MKKKANHGLTLVELLITLSLMAIMSVGFISFFLFPNKAYDKIVVPNNLENDVDRVLRQFAADIHSAIKPDSNTNAVVIYNNQGIQSASGNMMYIYGYDNNKYIKIMYKYEDGVLYKGSIVKDTAQSIIITSVNTYSEILRGVIYPSEGGLFQDITLEPSKNNQRTISINIIASDAKNNNLTSHGEPLILTTRPKASPY